MRQPVVEVDADGAKRWTVDGVLHREDGPAYESVNARHWYLHGLRHREDGPAREWPDGSKEWWLHGQRHREDGPAVEFANGTKAWYRRGRCHREDGPAREWSDGTTAWWLDDKHYAKPEWLREVLKDRPLTLRQRELLDALSENWAGTPDLLYTTATQLAN